MILVNLIKTAVFSLLLFTVFLFITCLLSLRAYLLNWILIAIVLLCLVVFISILITLIRFPHVFFTFLTIELFIRLFLVILLIFSYWFSILIKVSISILETFMIAIILLIVASVVQLAFLNHALQVFKDHLAGKESSDQSLHLYYRNQGAFIDLDIVLFVILARLCILLSIFIP